MSHKFRSQRISLPLILLFCFLLIGSVVAAETDPWLRPDVAPAPPENQLTPARVHLGQLLFLDPRLSRKSTMSCATDWIQLPSVEFASWISIVGMLATMPAMMISEMPLPMPYSVICSPIHMTTSVPVVSVSRIAIL